MTSYIANIRFSSNDQTICVNVDLWQGGECTAHTFPVSVSTGHIDTTSITSPTALLALRKVQANAFVRRTVAQRRKDITARLIRQEEREAA